MTPLHPRPGTAAPDMNQGATQDATRAAGAQGRLAVWDWHGLEASAVMAALDVTDDGLGEDDARRRLAEFGPNALDAEPERSAIARLLDQFRSP